MIGTRWAAPMSIRVLPSSIGPLETAEHLSDLAQRFPGLQAVSRLYRSRAKSRVRKLIGQGSMRQMLAAGRRAMCSSSGLCRRSSRSIATSAIWRAPRCCWNACRWPTIADRALHTYRNALIGIHTFGGCAISYEEMVDPQRTALDASAGRLHRARLPGPGRGARQDRPPQGRAFTVKVRCSISTTGSIRSSAICGC